MAKDDILKCGTLENADHKKPLKKTLGLCGCNMLEKPREFGENPRYYNCQSVVLRMVVICKMDGSGENVDQTSKALQKCLSARRRLQMVGNCIMGGRLYAECFQ